MVKLVALYEKPDDEQAFWEHYEKVHAPLTRELPGLQDLELLRVTADAFGGEAPFYLVATMSFADEEAFKAAMRSDENKRLGKDLMSFAKGKVKVLVTETHAV
ncbi:MAG TPA: EthD family reductase [Trueperaceae bacterium]|nr:EthD family reductase [Trueperaceae bacterium]